MTLKEALQNGNNIKEMAMAGMIDGGKFVHVYGRAPAVVAATVSVWPIGTAAVYANPASASVLTIVSASANDAAAGTGARTILVKGLDANYLEIEETVTLNGTTAVTTTASFLRIHSMSALTAGSGGLASGNITATISSTTYAIISTGYTYSYNCNYTVPAGKTAYVIGGSITSSAATILTANFLATPQGKAILNMHTMSVYQQPYQHEFYVPLPIPEKTDIDVRALGTATSTVVNITYDMIVA
jgi:hypothetical protein